MVGRGGTIYSGYIVDARRRVFRLEVSLGQSYNNTLPGDSRENRMAVYLAIQENSSWNYFFHHLARKTTRATQWFSKCVYLVQGTAR